MTPPEFDLNFATRGNFGKCWCSFAYCTILSPVPGAKHKHAVIQCRNMI